MSVLKKHRLVMAVVALLILAAAILLFYRFAVAKSPDRVLTKYMACIEEKKYEDMYAMLDRESQELINKEDFITRNRNIYEGVGAKNIRITMIRGQEKKGAVQYKTAMDSSAGKIRFPNEAKVHKESGRYRITWQDSLIFPQLNKEDKVKVVPLKANRGNLYDRRGILLAGKGKVAAVGLIPGKMSKDPAEDLKKLSQLLDMPAKDIESKLQAKWVKKDLLVPIKKLKKINEKSSSTVSVDNEKLQKELLKIPGIVIGDEDSRIYPLAEKAAHLVGYVQGISAGELANRKDKGYDAYSLIGKSGLEKQYEKRLHGIDGEKISIYNNAGNEKAVMAELPQKNGEDITLTIDARLQTALYNAYKKDKSCSVAMNPRTGEVLALVSTPSYDGNDFVVGMSDKRWKQLTEDKNMPMYNRFKQTWSPGSSLKPIIGAIGVASGKLDPAQDFGHSGRSWQKSSQWGGYKVTTLHEYGGSANLQNALIHSDNIYFAKAALKIGKQTLTQQFEHLGFGTSVPFELSVQPSTYSNETTIDTEIQLADSGYGQGELLVNPLHMACMYSAFVNKGAMIKPHLERKDKPSFWIENAFDENTAALIRNDLEQVVSNSQGTGYEARLAKTKLAGKTGTAEIKVSQTDTSGKELGWFCVFNPRGTEANALLMLTMVEGVKDRGGSAYVVKKYKKLAKDFMPADQ